MAGSSGEISWLLSNEGSVFSAQIETFGTREEVDVWLLFEMKFVFHELDRFFVGYSPLFQYIHPTNHGFWGVVIFWLCNQISNTAANLAVFFASVYSFIVMVFCLFTWRSKEDSTIFVFVFVFGPRDLLLHSGVLLLHPRGLLLHSAENMNYMHCWLTNQNTDISHPRDKYIYTWSGVNVLMKVLLFLLSLLKSIPYC